MVKYAKVVIFINERVLDNFIKYEDFNSVKNTVKKMFPKVVTETNTSIMAHDYDTETKIAIHVYGDYKIKTIEDTLDILKG